MRLAKFLAIIGGTLFIFSLFLWSWLLLPWLRHTASHTFSTSDLLADSGQSLPRTWSVKLTAPERIPLGESGTIRLELSPASGTANAISDDSLSDYYILAEARAEVPSAGTWPSGLSSQSLGAGSEAQFEWRVRPQSKGELDARVWLYLGFVPRSGGDATESPVSVLPLSIQAVTLAGRAAAQVRVTGLFAFWLGLALTAPYLVLRFRRRKFRDL
jgi:hypothetical protein